MSIRNHYFINNDNSVSFVLKDKIGTFGERLYSFKDMDCLLKRCYKVAVVNDGTGVKVVKCPAPFIGKRVINTIDVAFPIVHGTNCEDGTIAGFVTLLGIPFVGPDILSSSIGMDKILQKKVFPPREE